MPSEVWGYRVGDHVEVRTAVGNNAWEWRPGQVARFDVERNVWVGGTKVTNPRNIRRFKVPTTADEIEEFLGR